MLISITKRNKLQSYSKEKLIEIIKICEEELKKRLNTKLLILAEEAIATKHKYLSLIGEAIKSNYIQESWPPQQELAYQLADVSSKYYGAPLEDQKLEKLRQRLNRYFDEFTFIMTHTHYDECMNGFYMRRS